MDTLAESPVRPQTVKSSKLTPFLKWAGGKRWFVRAHSYYFEKSYKRYIEPFLGSGTVFFYLQPKHAILADINQDLIETYLAVKDNWKKIEEELKHHHRNHSHEHYFKMRKASFSSKFKRAARFIYLNRTCWNGLYRVNCQGKFNVPIGTKTNVILDTDDFGSISGLLQNATILKSDFEPIIDKAVYGDLIFVDPPYTVNHNVNGFIKYNEKLFSWKDQIRLKNSLVKAKERGAQIVMTNAAHKSIKDLYIDFGKIKCVKRQSILAADPSKRLESQELVIEA